MTGNTSWLENQADDYSWKTFSRIASLVKEPRARTRWKGMNCHGERLMDGLDPAEEEKTGR